MFAQLASQLNMTLRQLNVALKQPKYRVLEAKSINYEVGDI
jgi:hypothetical protein